jgi:hypothetical protein
VRQGDEFLGNTGRRPVVSGGSPETRVTRAGIAQECVRRAAERCRLAALAACAPRKCAARAHVPGKPLDKLDWDYARTQKNRVEHS